jgi:hypothetical protein
VTVQEPDDITWPEVRCRVIQESEVGAGRLVQAVDGHVRRGIDRLAALREHDVGTLQRP